MVKRSLLYIVNNRSFRKELRTLSDPLNRGKPTRIKMRARRRISSMPPELRSLGGQKPRESNTKAASAGVATVFGILCFHEHVIYI
jgi:hypothetical protein